MSEKYEGVEIETGVIYKAAGITAQEANEQELDKINKFALDPLAAEDVFTFKTMIGDNELDDRNKAPFTEQALKDLKELYIGTTMIKDHSRSAENQIARVYDTELITDSGRDNGRGEKHTELIGKCYMVKTPDNESLIKEIKAGIKKEVSSSCVPKRAICSICGKDNMKEYCRHFPGEKYIVNGKEQECLMLLDGAKAAYELSFVAVPAQPRAGTVKAFGDKPFFKADLPLEDTNTESKAEDTDNKPDDRLKELEMWAFVENEQA
ncbi:MAG: hypothetical protein K6F91_03645 [Ruminococcus sp.]|nr:hypothetical protein [Ruminococcus sp.]